MVRRFAGSKKTFDTTNEILNFPLVLLSLSLIEELDNSSDFTKAFSTFFFLSLIATEESFPQ